MHPLSLADRRYSDKSRQAVPAELIQQLDALRQNYTWGSEHNRQKIEDMREEVIKENWQM